MTTDHNSPSTSAVRARGRSWLLLAIGLLCILGASVAANFKLWRANRHMESVRAQEVAYARGFGEKRFWLTAEDGLSFFKDADCKEPLDEVEFKCGYAPSMLAGHPPDQTWAQHGSAWMVVDASLLNGKRYSQLGVKEAKWPVSRRILIRLLRQIQSQDPGWVDGRMVSWMSASSTGYLFCPAGMLVMVVHPIEDKPGLYLVETISVFISSVAQEGIIGGGANLPPREDAHYFKPHE